MGIAPPTQSVLDASVAVRWLVDESGSERARSIVESSAAWVAPYLLIGECASALRRKVVAGTLDTTEALTAIEILKTAIADGFLSLAPDHEIVSSALLISFETLHKLPDCLYIALAERDGLALATADVALSQTAQKRGVRVVFVSAP